MIKRMRKWMALILCVMLTIASTCVISSAESLNREMPLDDILQKDIATIYKNIDLGEEKTLICNTSDKVADFLEAKREAWQYVYNLNGIKKNNYKVTINLEKEEQIDGYKVFLYNVETEFNYGESSTTSGEGFEVIVKYDLTKKEIVDLYEPLDAFDMEVRGENTPSQLTTKSLAEELESTQAVPGKAEIREKCIRFKGDVLKQKTQDEKTVINEKMEAKSVMRASSALNYTAIKNWARNNYNKSSPSSGGSGVPYYDFSQLSGNYDCTNFVSHALLAGGAVPYKPSGASGISASGWYYKSLSDRSSSWSGVSNLHTFLTNNSGKGPSGVGAVYSTNGGTKKVGEILQFNSGSTWMHSTIITGFTDDSTAQKNYATVTGRTGKNSYNNNQDAREIYPNKARRTIISLRNNS